MAKDKGWVLIHRKIWDSAIWTSEEAFDRRSAWIDLILMANHEDKEKVISASDTQKIRRGQIHCSTKFLANRWGWSKNKVLRYLALLKSADMVTTQRYNGRTLITLIKYDDFQS